MGPWWRPSLQKRPQPPWPQINFKGKLLKVILVLIEVLTFPSNVQGKSIESSLVSCEILIYPLDILKGKSNKSKLVLIEVLTVP